MSAGQTEQPEIGVELDVCPRKRWYAWYGRLLRDAGWKLRARGERWEADNALIERRAAADGSRKAPTADSAAFASTAWLAAFERASDALSTAAVAAEKAGEKWAMYKANKAWWLLSAVMEREAKMESRRRRNDLSD